MTRLIRVAILVAAGLVPAAVLAQPFQQEGWIRIPVTYTSREAAFEGQSGPVTGRPLSADEVRHSTQTLSDGSHIEKSETDHFYRDFQGRMRTETETGAIIYDPIAGFTYDLTNWSKSYTKSPISPGSTTTIAAEAHHSSISSHSGNWTPTSKKTGSGPVTEALPQQMMNGVWVKGSRVTVTIPAGAVGNDRDLKSISEHWYSDDLKLLVKSSNADPRFGNTTYELTNIVQAPPDASLFQPPADYKEVTHH